MNLSRQDILVIECESITTRPVHVVFGFQHLQPSPDGRCEVFKAGVGDTIIHRLTAGRMTYLTVFNDDTASVTVKVSVSREDVKYTLVETPVTAGDTLQYVEQGGWSIF